MLPQFDIATYPSQLFWFGLSFAFVLVGIYKVVLPAYTKVLDKRIKALQHDFDSILCLQHEIAQLKQQRQEKLEKVQSETKKTMNAFTKKITTEQDQKLKKARLDHENAIAKFEQSMIIQKASLLENMQPFVQNCVEDVLKKFIQK